MLLKSIKDKTNQLKSWQWFLLLYLGGSIALILTSYGIKLLMATFP